MDPNECLRRILSTAQRIDDDDGEDEAAETYLSEVDMAEAAQELAQQTLVLHEWLQKGGFLPDAWRRSRGVPAVRGGEGEEGHCSTATTSPSSGATRTFA